MKVIFLGTPEFAVEVLESIYKSKHEVVAVVAQEDKPSGRGNKVIAPKVKVKAISHITGGGFYENIPRSIPDGFGAKIEKAAVKILPIFDLLAKTGNVSERDMFNTFNMGVGMSVVVDKKDADKAIAILNACGEKAYVMGEIVKSDNKIEIC